MISESPSADAIVIAGVGVEIRAATVSRRSPYRCPASRRLVDQLDAQFVQRDQQIVELFRIDRLVGQIVVDLIVGQITLGLALGDQFVQILIVMVHAILLPRAYGMNGLKSVLRARAAWAATRAEEHRRDRWVGDSSMTRSDVLEAEAACREGQAYGTSSRRSSLDARHPTHPWARKCLGDVSLGQSNSAARPIPRPRRTSVL